MLPWPNHYSQLELRMERLEQQSLQLAALYITYDVKAVKRSANICHQLLIIPETAECAVLSSADEIN